MNHWSQMAYLMRYAHQPASELRELTRMELSQLHESILEIVRKENTPKKKK